MGGRSIAATGLENMQMIDCGVHRGRPIRGEVADDCWGLADPIKGHEKGQVQSEGHDWSPREIKRADGWMHSFSL